MTATRTRTQGPRGLTLIELLIAVTVAAVVIAGVVAVVAGQQKAYASGQQARLAQGSARAALGYLETELALAGYGVDPAFAIDLDRYTTGPCNAALGAPCARDSTSNPDELVFLHRNLNYWVPPVPTDEPRGKAWRITATSNSSITVNARQGDQFLHGQIVQAVCRGGKYYAYAQVKTPVPTLAADQSVPLDLEAVGDGTNPFRRQDLTTGTANGSACFASGMARLFMVDRYRFHIRPVLVGTVGGVNVYDPYLVLDMGVSTSAAGPTEADEVVVAEGIELMQVAYVLANGALTTPVVGQTAGTPITLAQAATGSLTSHDALTTTLFPGAAPAGQASVYSSSSWYGYSVGPPPDTARTTDHQANIRAVKIALVARSPLADAQGRASLKLDGTFQLYNLNTVPTWISNAFGPNGADDGYQRNLAETTVSLPNMLARGQPYF